MRYLLMALVLSVCGCVDQRYFAPRENRNGTGPGGYPAAVYPFASEGRDVDGELRIWSRGASGEADDRDPDAYRVEVHVGFELENNGETPLELAGVRSERDDLSLVRIEGEARAAPGSTARVDSWFLAPGASSAADVSDFAIRHEVVAGDRKVLNQVTPFSFWYRPDPRDYDPWFFGHRRYGYHGHWGFGLGFGWGCY